MYGYGFPKGAKDLFGHGDDKGITGCKSIVVMVSRKCHEWKPGPVAGCDLPQRHHPNLAAGVGQTHRSKPERRGPVAPQTEPLFRMCEWSTAIINESGMKNLIRRFVTTAWPNDIGMKLIRCSTLGQRLRIIPVVGELSPTSPLGDRFREPSRATGSGRHLAATQIRLECLVALVLPFRVTAKITLTFALTWPYKR